MTTLESCLASRASDLELVSNGAKVRCKMTGHEMPALLERVEEYLKSKKFLKAKAGTRTMADLDFSKYEPHVVQHSSNNKMLYCTLTKQKLAKVTSVVEKHVNGRRFKEALKQHEEEAAKPKKVEKRKKGKGKGKGSEEKKAKVAKTVQGEAGDTKGDDAKEAAKGESAEDASAGKTKKGKGESAGEASAEKTKKKKVKRAFLRRDREAAKKAEKEAKGKKKIKMKKSPKLAGQ